MGCDKPKGAVRSHTHPSRFGLAAIRRAAQGASHRRRLGAAAVRPSASRSPKAPEQGQHVALICWMSFTVPQDLICWSIYRPPSMWEEVKSDDIRICADCCPPDARHSSRVGGASVRLGASEARVETSASNSANSDGRPRPS